jgi:hypothetical protein
MKILLAATALALAAAAPAFAPGQQAQAQTYSKEQSTTQKVTPHKVKKIRKVKTERRVVRYGSPYSTNPAHDAYVNGVYVGSDPDPRIRATLKREYCAESVDGCGAP